MLVLAGYCINPNMPIQSLPPGEAYCIDKALALLYSSPYAIRNKGCVVHYENMD